MPAAYPQQPTDVLVDIYSQSRRNSKGVNGLENARDVSAFVTPTLLNNYAAPTAPKKAPQYRLHFRTDSLEIVGHIDVSAAFSGDVAFYLLEPFWRSHDISYTTDVETGPTTFSVARVFIDSVDGAVYIYWPAT